MPSWSLILSLLTLLLVANMAPVVVRIAVGDCLDWAVDGGKRLGDGRPIFGDGKTYRGVVVAVVASMAAAEALGLGWRLGLIVGGAAMAGDLGSSFVKRRLGHPAHARVPLLDDLPEALLPVAAVAEPLGLSLLDGSLTVLGFVLIHTLLDPLSRRA